MPFIVGVHCTAHCCNLAIQFADSCNISKPHAISILQFARDGLYIVQLDEALEGKTLQSFIG